MSEKPTRYLLYGRNPNDNRALVNTLRGKFPTEIPKEFVHEIIIHSDDKKIVLEGSSLEQNLRIKDPTFLDRTFGIKFDVERVDVILDVDIIEETVSAEAKDLLSNVFYS